MSGTSAQSSHERELFVAALEKSPGERDAWLDRACGADHALRQRLQELMGEGDRIGDFLETPVLTGARPPTTIPMFGPGGTALIAAVTEKPGDPIGRYKLLQKIGEGGCGVVYMAEQQEPVRRRVALKVIKLGMDTKSVIARFEAERQALAMMDHPNIAKVLDAGATEAGRPYFVMELVRGIKITEYCDEKNLPTEERLALFIQVCQAIGHAHQKGIIHRDIKPSNILVTLHDGTPVPKVIDFGIAKATEHRLTDKTLFTEFTTFIGTPAYMSPEQAQMSGLDIDTRSDIYSLGVLLYELLTGKTPFDAETLLEAGLDACRRTIREQEPARPSTRLAALVQAELTTTAQQRHTDAPKLIHLLRGDLDWIAMRCLEKDRGRRYETANALAADVQRYLDGEPVLARPPSNVYRLQKLMKRHRGAIAAAACIAATLLGGIVISTWQALRATVAERKAHSGQLVEAQLRQQADGERERAEREKGFARVNEYVADMNLANQSLAAGNLGRSVQLLEKHRPQAGEPDLRGFEWRYLWQLCRGDEHIAFPDQEGSIHSVAYSPDGKLLALGMRERVSVFDVASRTLVTNLVKSGISLAFLPDGKTLLTASPTTVRAWRVGDWAEQKSLPENSGPFALSADGNRLATLSRGGARIWDTRTWEQLRVIPEALGPLALSSNGTRIVVNSRAGITVWPVDGDGKPVVLLESTNIFSPVGPWLRPDRALVFSPNSKYVIAARNSLSERGVFVLSIWNADSGEESVMPDDPEHIEHTGAISSMVFSPDGQTLATASFDHSIRLWDFADRQRISTLQGHVNEVWAIAFSPDGQTIATGGKDGTVKLWPAHAQKKDDVIAGTWQPLAFSRDSKTLAALNRERAVVLLNMATREPEDQFQLENQSDRRSRFGPFPSSIAVSGDPMTIAHSLDDGTVQIVNTKTHDSTFLKNPDGHADVVALSPDGQTMVTGARGRLLRWWDLRRGTNLVQDCDVHRVLFSPDGGTLAVFQRGDAIELWDVPTRTLRTNLLAEAQLSFGGSAFSPDGRLLAVVCQDYGIRLWDTRTVKLVGICTGHKQGVFSVAFTPDGKTLASTSDDSTLKLWNVPTQQELLTIRRLGGSMRELLFSPDGRMLVGARGIYSRTGGLRFYRAPLLSEIEPPASAPPKIPRRLDRPPGPRGRQPERF